MDRSWTETVSPDETPVSSIRILSPGCEVGDRYEVRDVLGIGGSGVVYAAFDRELRRDVALKVLRNDRMTESALKRFRREVAVARDVHSPHLVRIFDIGSWADSIYLTMELVEGQSLAHAIEQDPLSIEQTIGIASQILEALATLHAMAIVHRDVKPSNVMLTGDGLAKLTDFGLARRTDSETRATETEGVVGTYEYLAPEQALGKPVDGRSDLYSFGILLYECLTGDVPLRSGSSLGTAIAHVSRRPPDVRVRRPETPRWLAAVVARLLAKDPADRYQTAAAVRADLQRRRRPPPRLRNAVWWAPLAIALLAGIGSMAVRENHLRGFDRLIAAGMSGGSAINRRGETLWTDDALRPVTRATEVTLSPGARPVLAAIRQTDNIPDPINSHRLLLLDPVTRATQATIELPSQASAFPGSANWFSASRVTAIDIDQDGAQELVVTYVHNPYWPSYSILVDPRRGAARPILIASGHHTLAATHDLDGDGRQELIFTGVSNRLGWNQGVAAVRVDPKIFDGFGAIASTPDENYAPTVRSALMWYALIDDGGYAPGGALSIDTAGRRIILNQQHRAAIVLGFDGLPTGNANGSRLVRALARRRSYDALRSAHKLSRGGFHRDAVAQIVTAVAEADRAVDPPLAAWTRRVEVRLMVRGGASEREVEPLIHRVIEKERAPADACWDFAVAFHVAGKLDAALRWYREGLKVRTVNDRGRMSWEFIEGILFVLVERGEWDDARRVASGLPGTDSSVSMVYRTWIDWRATGLFSSAITGNGSAADHGRYLALEWAAAQPDADLITLQSRATQELSQVSESYQPLIRSLQSELQRKAGNRQAAFELARSAYDQVRLRLDQDTVARAHFDVVARRYAATADEHGQAEASSEALRTLRQFRASGGN